MTSMLFSSIAMIWTLFVYYLGMFLGRQVGRREVDQEVGMVRTSCVIKPAPRPSTTFRVGNAVVRRRP